VFLISLLNKQANKAGNRNCQIVGKRLTASKIVGVDVDRSSSKSIGRHLLFLFTSPFRKLFYDSIYPSFAQKLYIQKNIFWGDMLDPWEGKP
jgi:hypothetical protein